jgi:hypothetical protein
MPSPQSQAQRRSSFGTALMEKASLLLARLPGFRNDGAASGSMFRAGLMWGRGLLPLNMLGGAFGLCFVGLCPGGQVAVYGYASGLPEDSGLFRKGRNP